MQSRDFLKQRYRNKCKASTMHTYAQPENKVLSKVTANQFEKETGALIDRT